MNDEELAFTLAHELAHILKRHDYLFLIVKESKKNSVTITEIEEFMTRKSQNLELQDKIRVLFDSIINEEFLKTMSETDKEKLVALQIKADKKIQQSLELLQKTGSLDSAQILQLQEIMSKLSKIHSKIFEFKMEIIKKYFSKKKELQEVESLYKKYKQEFTLIAEIEAKTIGYSPAELEAAFSNQAVAQAACEKEADEIATELLFHAGIDYKKGAEALFQLTTPDVVTTEECKSIINAGEVPEYGNQAHPYRCWRFYNIVKKEYEAHYK